MAAVLLMKLLSGECISRLEEGMAVSEDFVRHIFQSYSQPGSCGMSVHELEVLGEALSIGGTSSGPDAHPDGHTSHRRKRDIGQEVGQGQNDSSTDHVTDLQTDITTTCLSMEALLKSFGLDPDHSVLNKTDFMRLCPALIQQATQGCKTPPPPPPTTSKRLSPAEVYGYGTLSIILMSIVCFFGLVIVHWRGSSVYIYVMSTMLGLGVGSLVGDALLHLVPQALGLDVHSPDETSHADEGIVVEPYLLKMLCACGSIWFYYLLQLGLYKMGLYVEHRRARKNSDQAGMVTYDNNAFSDVTNLSETSKVHFSHDHNNCQLISSVSLDEVSLKSSPSKSESKQLDGEAAEHHHHHHHSHGPQGNSKDSEDAMPHVHSSVAWMIMIGDGIHNFADGLAVGAAFSASWQAGWATSIAIFAHEIPHEFGDIAVMLSAGWSTGKVALAQMASQFTAFIGLYIGISLTESNETAQQWIFAITCGMFLYISLADIVSITLFIFHCLL